ncbi:hypothetical protein BJY01DRAFT_241765 [Aspergillus pseudoustus]|uniref:Hydrophobic surface binding protein A-domain-containing protein n=1 Tax=Aspergillus pseudoustus TaxID=1810923 RepID=A0ABR4L1K8_9EURO
MHFLHVLAGSLLALGAVAQNGPGAAISSALNFLSTATTEYRNSVSSASDADVARSIIDGINPVIARCVEASSSLAVVPLPQQREVCDAENNHNEAAQETLNTIINERANVSDDYAPTVATVLGNYGTCIRGLLENVNGVAPLCQRTAWTSYENLVRALDASIALYIRS